MTKKLKLEILKDKIESNTAKVNDYKRYEELVDEAGLKENYLEEVLSDYGYENWSEYYRERKKSYKVRDRDVEGALLGIITGLALIAIKRI